MSETQTVTQIAAMTFVDTVSEDFRLGHCCLSSLALMKPEAVGQQLILYQIADPVRLGTISLQIFFG